MPVDDDLVLDDVEAAGAPVSRGSRRGFWVVLGALVFAGIFVLIEIFANFGVKDTIAHAEHSLRLAEAAADRVKQADGSYAGADDVRLTTVEPTLQWNPGDAPSDGLQSVSVATAGSAWGAAVQARPGACFYLHLTDDGSVLYGVGTVCTGQEALQASDPRW